MHARERRGAGYRIQVQIGDLMAGEPGDDPAAERGAERAATNKMLFAKLHERLHRAVADVCREMQLENDPARMATTIATLLGAQCIRTGTDPDWLLERMTWLVRRSEDRAAAEALLPVAPPPAVEDLVRELAWSRPSVKPCGCPVMTDGDVHDVIGYAVWSDGVNPKTIPIDSFAQKANVVLSRLGFCAGHRPIMCLQIRTHFTMQGIFAQSKKE